jgi:FeS assembly SUF system regulator
MIRITKQTDYGIVLLSQMAVEPHRQFNAPELAEAAGLPLPMVSKILKQLVRERLLTSHRGVKGGYSLARSSDDISVAELIAALEGPIALTECISVEGDCSHEASCKVRSNWERINDAVRGALEGISLSEMARPHAPRLVTLGNRGLLRPAPAAQG